jgi:Tfp pilus assembly protein PilO
MIAILLTIVILLSVFFVTAIYYPLNKRAKRTARSRAILEAQVDTTSPSEKPSEVEEKIKRALEMDVNFFKRRDIPPQKGIPELLEQVNKMGNQMNIRFVAVKPLDEEKAPDYRRYPFLIETKSGYPELVNFVQRIENGLRLTLNDLKIETDAKTPLNHLLRFTLNIYELENSVDPHDNRSDVKPIFSPVKVDLVAVARDPFSPKKQPKAVEKPKLPKKPKAKAKKPKRPKLTLMGIMEVAGHKRAIINNQSVREGETIRGQTIQEIAEDHIVVRDGKRIYSLYLKESTSSEGGETKP